LPICDTREGLQQLFLLRDLRINGLQCAISCPLRARNCSIVVLAVSAPVLRMVSFTSGSSASLIRSSESLRMMGSGVFDGAMTAFHD
jgi:hypothetical protein